MGTDINKPVTAVIVGCGHRAMIYAEYAKLHPDELKIVGAADPSPSKRKKAQEEFGISSDKIFESAEELAQQEKFADAVINGTMDSSHVKTSVPLLNAGYDMLLEKPFAVNETEAKELIECIKRNGSNVMVCHVLRYAHFYKKIKELIINNTIGNIITIATNEYVSFDHMATSYVRGKWARLDKCKSTMLLAKCSHDLDIITWLMGSDKPYKVCSFGSRSLFTPENAPKEAGTRCTLDCELVDSCIYSAKRIYIDRPGAWDGYVWSEYGSKRPDSEKEMIKSLNTTNPYGRCVYKCDNDVVDRQSVLISFKSGATATHNMIGGSSGGCRTIHITGTAGEIYGCFDESVLHVKIINPSIDKLFDASEIDFTNEDLQGHGGGDMQLMNDFVKFLRKEKTSVSCTDIYDSIAGHLTVFMADKSNQNGGIPEEIKL